MRQLCAKLSRSNSVAKAMDHMLKSWSASACPTMRSLIVTATMNDVDPQAWLADVLARIAEHRGQRLDKLQPLIGTPPVASPTLSRAISNLLRACLSPVEHQFPPCYRNGRKNFRSSQATQISKDYGGSSARKAHCWKLTGITREIDRTRAAALCAVGPIIRLRRARAKRPPQAKMRPGNAAVVGAGSVVMASVERETIVAGNPAKFVGKRSRNTLAIRSS